MVKCKCKADGSDILLHEFWKNHSIEFQQLDSGKVEREGILQNGSPYMVQAFCMRCRRRWKLRGVTQISELEREEKRNGK